MRSLGIGCLVLIGVLAGIPVQAGVYNSFEREMWPLPGGLNAIGVNRDLRACTVLYQTAKQKAALTGKKLEDVLKDGPSNRKLEEILKEKKALEQRNVIKALSTMDRIDLSACYIRLGEFGEAEKLLVEGLAAMPGEDAARFMLLANLAAAYHGMGEDHRAVSYQEQALAAWPSLWAGWTTDRLHWYRRCERANLNLLRFRARESPTLKGSLWQTVDPLFPRVKFIGANEEYEAGAIAPRMMDELPADSANLVLQLLLWTPLDDRLYWLLGELVNAYGQVPLAAVIFKDNRFEGYASVRDLFLHRQVILHANDALSKIPGSLPLQLMAALAPRGAVMAPGLGAVCNETGPVFLDLYLQLMSAPPTTTDPPLSTQTQVPLLPSGQVFVVSFAAGCVVGALLLLQWREWRRRLQPAAQRESAEQSPAPEEAEAPTATP